MKGVPINQSVEEFVSDMGQRQKLAAMKGVTTMHRKEEFVRGMGQRRKGIFAVIKDVPIRYRMEDYASDMVRKLRLAVLKDAPIKQGREEFVQGMAHRGQ